jgi:hypothetical protein
LQVVAVVALILAAALVLAVIALALLASLLVEVQVLKANYLYRLVLTQ